MLSGGEGESSQFFGKLQASLWAHSRFKYEKENAMVDSGLNFELGTPFQTLRFEMPLCKPHGLSVTRFPFP